MPKLLRYTFLIHAVVAAVVGALLLAIPGRFLAWFDWAPVDPIISRLLGAALLALAWSSFRGWRATDRKDVAILVELEAGFCALACAGLLRHLLFARYPFVVWAVLIVFAVFTVAWGVSLLLRE